jgi:hypothetical protein
MLRSELPPPPAVEVPRPLQLTREEMIARGIPIVRRIAFRMARRLPPNVDVGDLIGAGTEGLRLSSSTMRRAPRASRRTRNLAYAALSSTSCAPRTP